MQKLLSDITEIQCLDGKLYLSAVLDCYNGEILSIAMDDNMRKELCIRTVEELKQRYGKKLDGAIFHSDRGSQYTSEAFKDKLRDAGLVQSLSGAGHCFDNARMESFFATLKKEKIYRIAAYKLTREQAAVGCKKSRTLIWIQSVDAPTLIENAPHLSRGVHF